jgi:2-keto-4-pentenoate hydratase/2-oxohepta-3-ene-1,7-dioic acid hydratase in catechol pathway
MRVARYRDPATGLGRYGIIEEGTIFATAGDPFADAGLHRGDVAGQLGELPLLAPVQPGKIVCVGLNYLAHVTERDATRKVPEEPVLFMKPTSALIGPGELIRIVNPAHRTDFEAELVIVIGRTARDVPEADALSYVYGYTAGNDVSDRDLQGKDGQWVRAKGFHTYCPVGPWIETDLDVADVVVESRLNGEIRQASRTSNMIVKPAFLIAYISRIMTLDPGDIILTGTPEGVGALTAGDTIEIEVGGVGVLSNPVVDA